VDIPAPTRIPGPPEIVDLGQAADGSTYG
jgi:hypothetical protein